MEANAHIIAALERLEAAMATPESKEWLASRKEIGRQIDPDAAEVIWQFESVLDPYQVCKDLPDQLQLVGREYFARSLDTEDWVSFDDLPQRRRIHLIPFTVTIPPGERDPDLTEKLIEWLGELRWMIEGCLAWQKTDCGVQCRSLRHRRVLAGRGRHGCLDRGQFRFRPLARAYGESAEASHASHPRRSTLA
jgi:hypothetical protein